MKTQLIAQIERELEMIMDTNDELAINKHLYTIETLARLAQETQSVSVIHPSTPKPKLEPAVTEQELRMMGAKVPYTNTNSKNLAVTDDGFGNGESLFDF